MSREEQEVAGWLESIGAKYTKHAPALVAAGFDDVQSCNMLTEADLRELGCPAGHARVIVSRTTTRAAAVTADLEGQHGSAAPSRTSASGAEEQTVAEPEADAAGLTSAQFRSVLADFETLTQQEEDDDELPSTGKPNDARESRELSVSQLGTAGRLSPTEPRRDSPPRADSRVMLEGEQLAMAEQLAAHVAATGGLHPLEMELAVAMGSEQFQMAHMVSVVGRAAVLELQSALLTEAGRICSNPEWQIIRFEAAASSHVLHTPPDFSSCYGIPQLKLTVPSYTTQPPDDAAIYLCVHCTNTTHSLSDLLLTVHKAEGGSQFQSCSPAAVQLASSSDQQCPGVLTATIPMHMCAAGETMFIRCVTQRISVLCAH